MKTGLETLFRKSYSRLGKRELAAFSVHVLAAEAAGQPDIIEAFYVDSGLTYDGKVNATLPKNLQPADVTLEKAVELIQIRVMDDELTFSLGSGRSQLDAQTQLRGHALFQVADMTVTALHFKILTQDFLYCFSFRRGLHNQ